MRRPEEELLKILQNCGVDFTASLPCEKIKALLEMIESAYGNAPLRHVPLTREEEGVGICAGAALSGKRPSIFVQSSGIGNMINALLSLTGFYELPLAIFISQRGIYKEKIEAQAPMGTRLGAILKGAGIPFSVIGGRKDFVTIEKKLRGAYKNNKMHAFLLSPAIWEGTCDSGRPALLQCPITGRPEIYEPEKLKPRFTRFEVLEIIAPFLDSKVVVCNLGFPSKELYSIKNQPSNFYMLGSMGMATPIGLGISLTTEKEVIVIDGDGSLLMNPGVLATSAHFAPENLKIIAIDNSSYGSTGNQPTLTGSCVDLELVAKGFGIRNTVKAAGKRELVAVMKNIGKGLKFIHLLAVPGNKDLPNIPLSHSEIKSRLQNFLNPKNAHSAAD